MGLYDTLMNVTNTAYSAKNAVEQARTIASNSQPLPEKNKEENAELAYIREHGFTTYVKEIEERKIEEMRAKMLQSMGLDEEALAEMDGTQRQAIEKAISDAIEQKLNGNTVANAEMNTPESESERRDKMQVQIAFNPRMFDVFTELQSQLPAGSSQSILGDDNKNAKNTKDDQLI
ncbi:MAG: hypothetical protein CMO05_05885 [Thalassospira sp.]|uniref:hypothetical protein n=1 Tax=Thalassospira sp. GB04J01 TaxID=1485225 RepID=UPI000C0F6F73|nr:hypothetical protein [Thalassospira sp. GB04J01]MBV16992.1 hypothetical protein [Thalassospira sp.]|tara:strand:+ start:3559 stop:4086 length:528 start_codon:yes stop_codon:yes gene_type:complete